ncbi:hypothetical protein [Bordetella sp. FB-8]|uniref:hypothetical protein n=1 Tax=Bordetella sp. FB-8 TaxID=1159870 RepID=UPI00037025D4|nr:hypothetical protein [Bordetella sp. FB-8]
MISVLLPGGNHYIYLAISLACLSTLLTWIVWLAIAPMSRLWLLERRWLSAGLMAGLAVVGGIYPYHLATSWLAEQRAAREAQARRDVLHKEQTVAGVAMPAGTLLHLRQPGKPDTFARAQFPQAVKVDGLQVREIRRHVSADTPARESWSVTLEADQTVQGWLCTHRHPVDLAIGHDGKPRFADCHLAEGNKLEGQPLPMGTWLARSRDDPQNWLLSTDGSEAAKIAHFALLKADVVVGPQLRIVSFKGLLARQTRLGEVSYPAGTRAATALNVPGAQPGDLLFTPPRGRTAHYKNHSDVQAGSSVLQAPDGTVRLMLDNRQAGIVDAATIRIGP